MPEKVLDDSDSVHMRTEPNRLSLLLGLYLSVS